MPREITIKVYQFDELSDGAKAQARAWYRERALDYDWWDSIYTDAESVGLRITEFDVDRNRHAKGQFIDSAPETAHKITEQHGEDTDTHKTATAFLKKRDAVVDAAPRDTSGELADEVALDRALDAVEADFLHDILEDYAVILQKECEYILSDEAVADNIRGNEYEFLENGKRA